MPFHMGKTCLNSKENSLKTPSAVKFITVMDWGNLGCLEQNVDIMTVFISMLSHFLWKLLMKMDQPFPWEREEKLLLRIYKRD